MLPMTLKTDGFVHGQLQSLPADIQSGSIRHPPLSLLNIQSAEKIMTITLESDLQELLESSLEFGVEAQRAFDDEFIKAVEMTAEAPETLIRTVVANLAASFVDARIAGLAVVETFSKICGIDLPREALDALTAEMQNAATAEITSSVDAVIDSHAKRRSKNKIQKLKGEVKKLQSLTRSPQSASIHDRRRVKQWIKRVATETKKNFGDGFLPVGLALSLIELSMPALLAQLRHDLRMNRKIVS
jgi:plasmid stabilization system protein ParE